MSRKLPEGTLPQNYTKTRIWKQLCLHKELGFGDALFGGEMAAWADKSAAMHLMERCETKYMRTVSMNTSFIAKVNPGDIVHFYGEIVHIGNTSVTLEMDIYKIDVENGDVAPVGTVTTVFVRVSEEGKKRRINSNVRKRILLEIEARKTAQDE
jgi:acyl-CoA thioesterase YciA